MWNNIKSIKSADKNVLKFVFEKDDAIAESVLYKYPIYEERTVICCSTQSGCGVGCRFCGAGDYFVRSLTCDEIVNQPDHLLDYTGVDVPSMKRLQIMFMSMGEPLLNLKNLIPAMRILYKKYPNAALLISTIGPVVDLTNLYTVCQEIPTIGLQFSVHESTDEKRNKLIPFKHKMTLCEIAYTGETWSRITGRKPFFNYCVHDKNNTDEDVNNLRNFFNPDVWEATISVICERDECVAKANARQLKLATDFDDKLKSAGYNTRTFSPAGQDDIGGGCGQLFHVQKWMKANPDLAIPSVGHDLPIVHMPK